MANALNIFKNKTQNPEIDLRWRDIGPKEAEELLSRAVQVPDKDGKYARNRILRSPEVAKLASDMKSGIFLTTAEALYIDEYGRLRNGQHRLNAVILSQTVQKFLVASVADGEAITNVIDIGTRRTMTDMHEMKHSEDPAFMSSMTDMIRRMDPKLRKQKLSDHAKFIWVKKEYPDMEDYWMAHRKSINYAYKQCGKAVEKRDLFYLLYFSRGEEDCAKHAVIREFIDYLINEPKGTTKPPSNKFKFALDALRDLHVGDALSHKHKGPLRMAILEFLCAIETGAATPTMTKRSVMKNRYGFVRNAISFGNLKRENYLSVWSKKELGVSG